MIISTRIHRTVLIALVLLFPILLAAQWGGALHFTWWEHDRVIVPDTPLLWPGQLDAGTVEMWFRPDTIFKGDTHDPDYTYLFCKNISGNYKGDMGMHWHRGGSELISFVQSGDAVNFPTQDIASIEPVFLPRWYHVAFVWDVQDSMRQFINGVQSPDVEPNTEGELCLPVSNGDQIITIGSGAQDHHFDRFETWRGSIDEVRISATARYTENFVPPEEPFEVDGYTVALWHFDEGEGTIASDASGFGFDGILGGADIEGFGSDEFEATPEWIIVQRDPKIIINEVLADPSSDANGDGTVDAMQDEFIELINMSANSVDLTGWVIGDDDAQDFTFPSGYTLEPFSFVTVFGGGDVSAVPGYNADVLQSSVLVGDGSLGDGLDESGDAIVVISPNGVDDAYLAWGTAGGTDPVIGETVWDFRQTTAANAANDNSLTRSPDASFELEDPFVEHLSVSANSYSPGQTIEGATRMVFTLTLLSDPPGAGTVEMDTNNTGKTEFAYGDFLGLTAVPEEGYVFSGWQGDETAQVNPIYTVMTKSKTITATFIPAFQKDPTVVINEINADPSVDPIYGDANRDWIRHAEQDEYIELLNVSQDSVDLSGWKLGDDEQFSFTFPEGYVLHCGEFVTVFGGGDLTVGPAIGYDPDPLLTHAFLSDSSQNNDIGNGLPNAGECVVLISPDTSYAMYVNYGSHYGRGVPQSESTKDIYFNMRVESAADGGKNSSITRYPDGNMDIVDAFVLHTDVSTSFLSPENSPSMSVGELTNICDLVSVDDIETLPGVFKLEDCYPNPFNPNTTIAFEVPTHTYVSMTIYNVKGQVVNHLLRQKVTPGRYEMVWNGLTLAGTPAPSGIYFYTLNSIAFNETKKMMLIK